MWRLLDALLEEAHRRSIDVLGLVATPAGRPLYEQRGFTPVGEVVVLMGTPAPAATAAAQPLSPLEDANVAPGIEERWLSCSRASMLRARFSKAIATASVLASDGTVVGYGMATAQGPLATVGPVMAETEEDARALITALLGSVSAPVRVDVPSDQAGFRQWLLRVGLREQAVRVEMALGAPRLPWQVPQRFRACGTGVGIDRCPPRSRQRLAEPVEGRDGARGRVRARASPCCPAPEQFWQRAPCTTPNRSGRGRQSDGTLSDLLLGTRPAGAP
jgi:hypothetical protein